MVVICREAGVISVVDGAQSIGQELDINLSEARPDFWVSVCPPILLVNYRNGAFVPKELSQMAFFEEEQCRSLCPEEVIIFSNLWVSDGSARGNQKPASHQDADPHARHLQLSARR